MKLKKESSIIVIFGAVFITVIISGLKIAGLITWSWWWVTLPLWIAPAIWLFVFTVLFTVGLARKLKR